MSTVASACPVCGRANECPGPGRRHRCWCLAGTVSADVLVRVGPPGRDGPCLCRSCLAGDVPSPCTRMCQMDPEGTACTSCLRTLDEIKAWFSATPGERAGIRLDVAGRTGSNPGAPG